MACGSKNRTVEAWVRGIKTQELKRLYVCGNDTELLTILVTLQRTMMQRPYGRIRLINSIIKSKFTRKRTLHRSSKS